MLTVGGLFSGIGGIELGLERAGMHILWHCEADPFCQHILSERWPRVPCFPDVHALMANAGRERGAARGRAGYVAGTDGAIEGEARERERSWHAVDDGSATRADVADRPRTVVPMPVPYVDVLCGGFPCQDISLAGAGAGIEGSRSGLWREFARLIGELRPRYVVIENVAALLARGLDRVLSDLAACGFDAEWDCVPASAVGAPHRRDRVWIVAYPNSSGRVERRWAEPARSQLHAVEHACEVAYADDRAAWTSTGREADCERLLRESPGPSWWATEPDVGRVAYGVPARVDRLRSLGNAVVPQVAEWIGHRILAYEREQTVRTAA